LAKTLLALVLETWASLYGMAMEMVDAKNTMAILYHARQASELALS
jgi:hypothetical protein